MIVGYARTSTVDQAASIHAQREALATAGCEKVFSEQTSSVADRAELEKALEFVREGDKLVVTKLDRLARSVRHLGELVEGLQGKGVSLQILDLGIQTDTPTGRLVLQLLGSIAEFERSIMLERQRIGIARAKADGKYKGRKPTARARASEARHLRHDGATIPQICERLGISRASAYRVLKDG
mgnify:CR=1 FL=1